GLDAEKAELAALVCRCRPAIGIAGPSERDGYSGYDAALLVDHAAANRAGDLRAEDDGHCGQGKRGSRRHGERNLPVRLHGTLPGKRLTRWTPLAVVGSCETVASRQVKISARSGGLLP